MNNENKVKLILFIAQSFSDEQCANILAQFVSRLETNKISLANSADWEEELHPRHEDGKFAPKGYAPGSAGRETMHLGEAEKWDHIGHSEALSRPASKIKLEISKIDKKLKTFRSPDVVEMLQAKRVQLVRDLANVQRDTKHSRRVELEEKVEERIRKTNHKNYKEYNEISDHMDILEDKYQDDNGRMSWPKTEEGANDRKLYTKIKRRKAKLEKLIDFKKAQEDEEIERIAEEGDASDFYRSEE